MPLSLSLAHDPQASQSLPRVIVAEDDEAFRKLISDTLRADGFAVEEVGDGASLFARMTVVCSGQQPEPIDLVLSATSLPGNHGIGLLLGMHAKLQGIPLILISRVGDGRTQVLSPRPGELIVTNHPFALQRLPELAHSLVSGRQSTAHRQ